MPSATELIAAERQRQIESEGWSTAHDDKHSLGDLARAAAVYSMPDRWRIFQTYPSPALVEGRSLVTEGIPYQWPWDSMWWKPTPDDRVRELVKAGALIVAEIERIHRANAPKGEQIGTLMGMPVYESCDQENTIEQSIKDAGQADTETACFSYGYLLDHVNDWDAFCDDIGLNPWLLNEGLAETSEKCEVLVSVLKRHGVL